ASRAVTEFLQNDLLAQAAVRAQAGPNTTTDPNLTVRVALDRAAARIEGRFTSQPAIEAAIRHTIGVTYQNLGVFVEAEKHLQRAVTLRRATAGAADPDTLSSMRALGFVLQSEGKHAAAETLLTNVLEQQQKRFGAQSAEAAETLNNLARTISAMGRHQ